MKWGLAQLSKWRETCCCPTLDCQMFTQYRVGPFQRVSPSLRISATDWRDSTANMMAIIMPVTTISALDRETVVKTALAKMTLLHLPCAVGRILRAVSGQERVYQERVRSWTDRYLAPRHPKHKAACHHEHNSNCNAAPAQARVLGDLQPYGRPISRKPARTRYTQDINRPIHYADESAEWREHTLFDEPSLHALDENDAGAMPGKASGDAAARAPFVQKPEQSCGEFPRAAAKTGACNAGLPLVGKLAAFYLNLLRRSQPSYPNPLTTLCPRHR